ncbi:MAG: DUF3530 family protein [Marinobacter sp.]|uniref:DUF3530 family protein n=1 Tax=Marinobacter sp. TaxID=50741 RepID=UPI003297A838
MSKWFERPVMSLFSILAISALVGAMTVQAQEAAESQGKPAEASAEDTGRGMISTGLDSNAIATKWPDAAMWLEPPDEERVLALFEPEADTPAKGALVILADEGQSAASGLAGALRQPVARAGWAVLTLGLEPPPYELQQAYRQRAVSAPEESQESAANDNDKGADNLGSVMIDVMDSVDVEELEDQYRTRVRKALSVAVKHLADRGYERVAVAGVGLAAGHVARMAGAADSGDVAAQIWVAPVFYPGDAATLTEWVSGTGQTRVLELHSSRLPEMMEGAGVMSPRQREAAFRREGFSSYTRQPVAMPERPLPRNAPALASRLSAWLAAGE